ncbi:MAG: VOC family protein [Bacteroidota bacterium]|nr:VOC family protein [Bacteroidota bacterium]
MKKIYLLLTTILFAGAAFSQSKPKAALNHTAIFVVNLQKAGFFYKDILGLDTVPEPFHDGKHIWLRTGEHTMLHIIQGAPSVKEYYVNQHTCFSVPSVQAFTQVLAKNHIAWQDVNGVKSAITTRVDGVHQIWLQDPDGYWLEINDDKF